MEIFRGSAQPAVFRQRDGRQPLFALKAFCDGLYAQLSNPKRRWCSPRCTALLPARIPTAFYYIVPLMSFLIDVQLVFAWWRWYCLPTARGALYHPAAEAADRHHSDGAGGAGPACRPPSPASGLHGIDANIVLLKSNACPARLFLFHHQHIDIAAGGHLNRAAAEFYPKSDQQ